MWPSTGCSDVYCFFFNDTATTEIYTLSLHDALPIFDRRAGVRDRAVLEDDPGPAGPRSRLHRNPYRSEEHTSELQSRQYLVCRLLLEKKNNTETLRAIRRSTPLLVFRLILYTHRSHS